jgi:hypothetical protein
MSVRLYLSQKQRNDNLNLKEKLYEHSYQRTACQSSD